MVKIYLNKFFEHDNLTINTVNRQRLGFKSSWSARILIGDIETMHMIRKEQFDCTEGAAMSAAQQFYSLAA